MRSVATAFFFIFLFIPLYFCLFLRLELGLIILAVQAGAILIARQVTHKALTVVLNAVRFFTFTTTFFNFIFPAYFIII